MVNVSKARENIPSSIVKTAQVHEDQALIEF